VSAIAEAYDSSDQFAQASHRCSAQEQRIAEALACKVQLIVTLGNDDPDFEAKAQQIHDDIAALRTELHDLHQQRMGKEMKRTRLDSLTDEIKSQRLRQEEASFPSMAFSTELSAEEVATTCSNESRHTWQMNACQRDIALDVSVLHLRLRSTLAQRRRRRHCRPSQCHQVGR